LYGGFVAWRKGSPPDWKDSMAVQIADENHWPELRAVILVVSDAKKDTSSTAGMSTSVATSTLLQHRIAHVVPQRMKEIEEAFLTKDFTKFGELTMKDSNQFHAVCADTYPPIFYMNDISRMAVRIVHAYNSWAGEVRAAYTFDAGPNAVLYTLDKFVVEVGALMLHYFPGTGSDDYISNPDFGKLISEFPLDPELIKHCDKTGRAPASGDVKMFYYTKSGPGPLPVVESNLDPTTGLNVYQPK
jgi:diphosphomevalonate decarboxylase